MLPQKKIDDGTLKMCKVEVKRNRRDSNVKKSSRIIGGNDIEAGFHIHLKILIKFPNPRSLVQLFFVCFSLLAFYFPVETYSAKNRISSARNPGLNIHQTAYYQKQFI